MTAQDYKGIVQRFINEAWNRGNLDIINEVVAPDYVYHDPVSGELQGRNGIRQLIAMYRAAFPDIRLSVEEQIAEGNRVATLWRATGTHTADLMGISATNRQSQVTGVAIDHFENGMVRESRVNWDALGMMQQLGVIPQLEEVAGG